MFSDEVKVSEACQINDLDHRGASGNPTPRVSEACQINDLDHNEKIVRHYALVSEACQINDLDHPIGRPLASQQFQKPVRSMT